MLRRVGPLNACRFGNRNARHAIRTIPRFVRELPPSSYRVETSLASLNSKTLRAFTLLAIVSHTIETHTNHPRDTKVSQTRSTMPPKRRAAAARTSSQQAQQSTLSFSGKNSKVTKPSSARQTKSVKKDPSLIEEYARTELDDYTKPTDPANETPAEEASIAEQTSHEADLLEPAQNTFTTEAKPKTENLLGGRAPTSNEGALGGTSGSGWVGDEEAAARKVKDAQIKKYWKSKEDARLAPRVHQEGLPIGEKILREWDMSGEFGVSAFNFHPVVFAKMWPPVGNFGALRICLEFLLAVFFTPALLAWRLFVVWICWSLLGTFSLIWIADTLHNHSRV